MKILVIRLSSLGDVVLTSAIYPALRQSFPQAKLYVAVKASFADLFLGNPDVDQVVSLAPEESLRHYIQRIRAEQFDIVVDLHGNIRSRLISFFSGAPRRVRYPRAALARRLFVRWRLSSEELQRHTTDRYFDALRKLGVPANPVRPKSILLIQTAFLGDAVLTTPLLTAIREKCPESKITVLATPDVADIFRNQHSPPEILIFDKRGLHRSLASRWKLATALKSYAFDWAIVPHRSFTSAMIAKIAGIPNRVGFSTSQGRWLFTHTVPFKWGVHDVDRNLGLLAPLGVGRVGGSLRMLPDKEASAVVSRRLKEAGISKSKPLLGINAGSVWATKRWLPERFAEVADRAVREGMSVVFVGGPKDKASVDIVFSHLKEKAHDWVGKTTLKELIALIAECQVFLTNDSGPMHIAAACGVPTVALFGPTTRELGFFPFGNHHTVIEKDLSCRPCGLHGHDRCPLGHFQCMKLISAEEVYAEVKKKI